MQGQAEWGLAEAAAYLRDNLELREVLGIDDKVRLEPRFLGAGEHNRNFRFRDEVRGEEYVLRVNVVPQPFHSDQVAYEHAALEILAPCGCTPQPLYLDNSQTAPAKGLWSSASVRATNSTSTTCGRVTCGARRS